MGLVGLLLRFLPLDLVLDGKSFAGDADDIDSIDDGETGERSIGVVVVLYSPICIIVLGVRCLLFCRRSHS